MQTYRISGAHELADIDSDFPLLKRAIVRHLVVWTLSKGGYMWLDVGLCGGGED